MRIVCRMSWVVLLVAFVSCGGDPTTDGDATDPANIKDGHKRMVAILKQIKDRIPEDHQYYGKGLPKKLRDKLASYDDKTSIDDRFATLVQLGYAELAYEPTPKLAIEHLTAAYEMLDEVPFPNAASRGKWSNRTKFYLAVAHLRKGETENCCLRHSGESCILPIRGKGIHTRTNGSRQAIKYFQEVLEDNAAIANVESKETWYKSSLWLLNIAYMTLNEFPDNVPAKYRLPSKAFESDIEFPQFANVFPKLGLDTFNHAGGAVVDDFNNDDYLDIFTTTSDPAGEPTFFINNGDGTFTDQSKQAGLTGLYGGLNLVQADYNNDGYVDVYTVRGAWLGDLGRHPNSLYRNNGDGTFTDVTFDAGLGEVHYPCITAAWADYDNDGHLDLFVGNENVGEHRVAIDRAINEPVDAPCQLYHNNGDGTFTDVAADAGVDLRRFCMGCVWGDYNNDRYPDLFVSGDGFQLLQNNRDGTFTNVADKLGIDRPRSPFAAWFWDFNNDGVLDIYVANYSGGVGQLATNALRSKVEMKAPGVIEVSSGLPTPTTSQLSSEFEIAALYRGDGDGGFDEVAADLELTYPTEPMGANFGDLNGDGYLDFYLATGNVSYWELRPNVMFLNQAGDRFANVTMAGRFGHLQKGHGVCFADLDNDGDQDVYVQMGGQLPGDKFNDSLFENPGFDHHWITLKLAGVQTNKSAIGARIHVTIVEDGEPRSIYRRVTSGGSFGCNPLRQNIGLGDADSIESIEIHWPTSDTTQTFKNVKRDQTIQIVEGQEKFTPIKLKRFKIGG